MISRRLHKILTVIHKWLGMNTLIFFALIFASGTVLVVSDEIEAVFHPSIWAAPTAQNEAASFGEIYGSVTREFPQGTLYVMQRQPQKWLADRSYVTTGWGEKIVVWSDPVSAEVLHVTSDRNFRTILKEFHDSLLIPRRIGFIFVSATSFVLLFSVISGLLSYRRFWKGFFRLPDRDTKSKYHSGMHRLVALWISVFLIIIAITGVFYTANGLGLNGYTPPFPAASERPEIRPTTLDGAQIARAEKVAVQGLQRFYPTTAVLPRRPDSGILFSGFSNDNGHLEGATTVSVDPVTLAIVGALFPKDSSGNARLKPLMNALHFGEWGGNFSRILWVIFGALSVYLMYNGAKIYLTKLAPNTVPKGETGRFIQGIGLFKWAYLALLIGLIALSVVRFGPGSVNWATLSGDSQNPDLTFQIHGFLREGKDTKYRLLLDPDQVRSGAVLAPDPDGKPQIFTSGNEQKFFEFRRPAKRDANIITFVLTRQNGQSETVVYNLGRAIW